MIDASILGNSQFLGRDGFRWWVGQIPPLDAQEDQLATGEGVGNRVKVRIMGYHPFNEDISNFLQLLVVVEHNLLTQLNYNRVILYLDFS